MSARAFFLAMVAFVSAGDAFPAALNIAAAAVERYEDGPPVIEPDSFVAGERVHFSLTIQGFARHANRVKETFSGQPLDFNGVPLAPPVSGVIDTTLTEDDKEWSPTVRGSFVLPELLFRGRYHLAIEVHDETSGLSASDDLSFHVSGPAGEDSHAIAIRELSFYAEEDSSRRLETAAYRGGEQIHARFRIDGYRHTAAHGIDVAYGISLADSSGRVVYSADAAAHDTTESFYPKAYVPCNIAFDLKRGAPPGKYTLKVIARDAVGGQQAEAEAAFHVE